MTHQSDIDFSKESINHKETQKAIESQSDQECNRYSKWKKAENTKKAKKHGVTHRSDINFYEEAVISKKDRKSKKVHQIQKTTDPGSRRNRKI